MNRYYRKNTELSQKIFSGLKIYGFAPEKRSELYVSNIPNKACIEDLFYFFGTIGPLFQIRFMVKPNGKNRGLAYITFINQELATKAQSKLNNTPFHKYGIKLHIMESPPDKRHISMEGIPTKRTKEEVWYVLKEIYNVKNIVDIVMCRNKKIGHKNIRYIIIEFETHEEASYYRTKFNDEPYIVGHFIKVDWADSLHESIEDDKKHDASNKRNRYTPFVPMAFRLWPMMPTTEPHGTTSDDSSPSNFTSANSIKTQSSAGSIFQITPGHFSPLITQFPPIPSSMKDWTWKADEKIAFKNLDLK